MLARRGQFHQRVLVAHLTPYHPAYREALGRSAALLQAHGSSGPDAGGQAQALLYGSMMRQSNMLAFSDASWRMTALCLAVVPRMFFRKRQTVSKGV